MLKEKKVYSAPKKGVNVKVVKMDDLSFDKGLFTPMRTKTRIDEFFSSDKGVMPGTNVVITGDPGVGKTTVLLENMCFYFHHYYLDCDHPSTVGFYLYLTY